MGYVVRSCGLFGIAGCKLKGGLNFVDTMIKMAREGKKLRVVDDQIVAPTPTDDLALQLAIMAEEAHNGMAVQGASAVGDAGAPGHSSGSARLVPGLYHAVSHGEISWYGFAKAALELAQISHEIEPVPSSVYAAPAQRPRYSVLDNAKLRHLQLDVMRPWGEGLARYVKTKYNKGLRLS
jgi:dTDP-4-dehydrorhamnose reductase